MHRAAYMLRRFVSFGPLVTVWVSLVTGHCVSCVCCAAAVLELTIHVTIHNRRRHGAYS